MRWLAVGGTLGGCRKLEPEGPALPVLYWGKYPISGNLLDSEPMTPQN